MRKRIFAVAGLALGVGLPPLGLHLGSIFGIFPTSDLDRASGYVRKVMTITNENYVDPKATAYGDLAHAAIHGMVESLDPHSEFLEAKDFSELEEDLSGEFGGVGIQVELRDAKIIVVAPMPGTPADKAGIRRGDEIRSIDGKPVAGNPGMDLVVAHLRGKPHTSVALGLYRPSAQREYALTLVRQLIKVDSISDSRVLDNDVGYVAISDFSEHTGEQFAQAVDGLLKKNINSLIIDLRNNPGGLLDAAVEVAEPFFRKGELIVYSQGRKAADREEFRSEAEGDPLDLPVAVLINQDTASAAEIVTGALKDTGRAVVVGERSFGKGSVQTIIDLPNGEGMRLTTAKYYTPSGVSLHGKGVSPQVEVVLSADDDDKIRQQTLRPDVTDAADFKTRFGFAPIEDRQLDAAVDVLKGVEIVDAQTAAAKAAPLVTPPKPAATGKVSGLPRHDRG